MHETMVVDSLLRTVLREMEEHGGVSVRHIHLRVGQLRSMDQEGIAFVYELESKGTKAEGAEIHVEIVPALARCKQCGVESALKEMLVFCDACGSTDMEILSGDEFDLVGLDMVGGHDHHHDEPHDHDCP